MEKFYCMIFATSQLSCWVSQSRSLSIKWTCFFNNLVIKGSPFLKFVVPIFGSFSVRGAMPIYGNNTFQKGASLGMINRTLGYLVKCSFMYSLHFIRKPLCKVSPFNMEYFIKPNRNNGKLRNIENIRMFLMAIHGQYEIEAPCLHEQNKWNKNRN